MTRVPEGRLPTHSACPDCFGFRGGPRGDDGIGPGVSLEAAPPLLPVFQAEPDQLSNIPARWTHAYLAQLQVLSLVPRIHTRNDVDRWARSRRIGRPLRVYQRRLALAGTDQPHTLDWTHGRMVGRIVMVGLGDAVRLDQIDQDKVGIAAAVDLDNKRGLNKATAWYYAQRFERHG